MVDARLDEDEFPVLAYVRAYADRCEQHLDPGWVREQLGLSVERMRKAGRGLAGRGLVEFFEWTPSKLDRVEQPELGEGPLMMDIRMTGYGCNYLRGPEG